jgi:[NiFe] hydrogenase assembly HybE family chaperone
MADFTPASPPAAALRARTEALVRLFSGVAQTRMAGVPILNPALLVEAVGFELVAPAVDEPAAVGVLITPWFMNLLWFPLARSDQAVGVGRGRLRRVGTERFDFIGGFEPGFGCYEACSLFSPMFEFADPAAARATAQAVLSALRPPAPAAAPLTPVEAPPLAARRAFLFGRRAATQLRP